MVGELIKRAREGKGWSQEDLARESGLRQEHISAIETGKTRIPRDHNLDALGKVLGITRAEFYKAAGLLEGLEAAMPPALPAETPTGDGDFDPVMIVRFVESHPDPSFQADLAALKRDYPDGYARMCASIYRAWTSNGRLAINVAKEVGG